MQKTLSKMRLLLLVLMIVCATPSLAADVIGTIVMMKGEVVANEAEAERYLDTGSAVKEGDTITSASRSFAVIELLDGTRIALQSSSSLKLDEYNQQRGNEAQVLELLRGGLRYVSGAIGKSSPQSVEVTARDITIGIRGTTFVARLCNSDACSFDKGIGENGRVVENRPREGRERIFRVDPSSRARSEISRLRFEDLLEGAYVGIVEGAISVRTPLYRFELEAGQLQQGTAAPQPGAPPPLLPNEPQPDQPPAQEPPKQQAPKPPKKKKGGKG